MVNADFKVESLRYRRSHLESAKILEIGLTRLASLWIAVKPHMEAIRQEWVSGIVAEAAPPRIVFLALAMIPGRSLNQSQAMKAGALNVQ